MITNQSTWLSLHHNQLQELKKEVQDLHVLVIYVPTKSGTMLPSDQRPVGKSMDSPYGQVVAGSNADEKNLVLPTS